MFNRENIAVERSCLARDGRLSPRDTGPATVIARQQAAAAARRKLGRSIPSAQYLLRRNAAASRVHPFL